MVCPNHFESPHRVATAAPALRGPCPATARTTRWRPRLAAVLLHLFSAADAEQIWIMQAWNTSTCALLAGGRIPGRRAHRATVIRYDQELEP